MEVKTMKNLTFDVPAYRFALVFPHTCINFKDIKNDISLNGYKPYIHGEEQDIDANKLNSYGSFNKPYLRIGRDEDNSIFRIPFTDVDGLTVGELLEFTKNLQCLIRDDCGKLFYYYPKYCNVMLTGYLQAPNGYMDMRLNEILLPSYWQKENHSQRFDKVIEQILMEDYHKFQGIEQKMADCFFERYQDHNYEDTLRRVRSLKQSR